MLIIGLGNLYRGDDAAGILAARSLATRGINAIEHAGGALDLIEIWTRADEVIIVDAAVAGAAPGTINIWDASAAPLGNALFRSSTHEFSLADAIELARALHRLPRKLTVYGIEGYQFAPGSEPSADVLAGVDRAVQAIEQIL